jgi:integrase
MKDPVSVTPCKHPRYKFRVRYPRDGVRVDAFFTNETEALRFAKKQRKETGEQGVPFGSLAEEERAAVSFWRNFISSIDQSEPPALLRVLTDYAANWKTARGSVTVPVAVAAYEATKKAEGLKPLSLQGIHTRCGRFAKDFADRNISTITTAEISDWVLGIKSLNTRGGEEVGLLAKRNYRLALSGLFTFAKSREWVVENPVTEAARPRPPKKRPAILKPDFIAELLESISVNAPDLLAFWCLRFFAGVREQEVLRMDWEMIDLAAEEVNLPDTVTKTGYERTIKILPALQTFLTPLVKKSGPIVTISAMGRRWGLKKALAGIKMFSESGNTTIPANVARHSFATYHLLAFRHSGETSLQLGHGGSPDMLNRHYKGVGTQKDALAFWKIRPQSPKRGSRKPAKRKSPTFQ